MDKTFNRFGRITRETPCNLEYNNGDGTVKQEEVVLRFVSLTTGDIRDQQAATRAKIKKGETVWHADNLTDVLHEIVEADGTVNKVTADLLNTVAVENVLAMVTAINDATRPKEPPAK